MYLDQPLHTGYLSQRENCRLFGVVRVGFLSSARVRERRGESRCQRVAVARQQGGGIVAGERGRATEVGKSGVY